MARAPTPTSRVVTILTLVIASAPDTRSARASTCAGTAPAAWPAAKVTEIRVTFSKEMADRAWSWAQVSDDTFPKVTGKPHYEKDRRTCVLPVKLEPGKTYVFWLNSEKFPGFRDTDGRPSVPYLLVFETRK